MLSRLLEYFQSGAAKRNHHKTSDAGWPSKHPKSSSHVFEKSMPEQDATCIRCAKLPSGGATGNPKRMLCAACRAAHDRTEFIFAFDDKIIELIFRTRRPEKEKLTPEQRAALPDMPVTNV